MSRGRAKEHLCLQTNRQASRIIGIFVLFISSCPGHARAEEQSGSSFLADIGKTCAGYIEVHANGTAASIKFQNYDLSTDGGNTLNITYNGVLLRKVQNFEAKDYVQCVQSLAAIMKDIQKSGK